ncbi:MAG: dual specificity protein phosphatase family protein [Lachnospiraceae bacterium]|nr:dual specificity protein phosphatase family protein [Lachnospiraceae bacterium]
MTVDKVIVRDGIEVRHYIVKNPSTLIIQITDKCRDFGELDKSTKKAAGVFKIKFDDEEVEHLGITAEQANDIWKFIQEHLDKNEHIDTIVCSCDGGVSRSAGLAAAILMKFKGDDTEIWSDAEFAPNKLVYKRMCDAMGVAITQDDIYDKEMINIKAFRKSEGLDD